MVILPLFKIKFHTNLYLRRWFVTLYKIDWAKLAILIY